MNYRIVCDTSSNIFALEGVDYAYAPLKIIAGDREYVDTPELDLRGMVDDLKVYKGKSGTSCPNMTEWLDAFGDADCVFAISITSNLSGAYNAACQAAEEYKATRPGAKVCVIDSLSTGPEMLLLAERIRERIQAGDEFDAIEANVREYAGHTHLSFILLSMNNLARNGRVSPAVAKLAGVLGICLMGKASDEGTLQPMHKCRGEKRAIDTLYKEMLNEGYAGGRVRIGHNFNEPGAQRLAQIIRADYPDADIEIAVNTALCFFYAEEGGLMVGFEDAK